MGLQGDVKAFSLDELLQLVSASGHLGTLNVLHKDTRKTLFLWQGGLYCERSTWSFRLGDVLVRRGEITPAHLDEALDMQREKKTTARLGAVLVRLGYTSQDKIMGARHYQVEEEIYELFGLQEAYFEFHPNELPDDFAERVKDPEEFRFDVRSVLMESARRKDEWRRIRHLLPSDKRLYVVDGADQEEKVKAILDASRGQKLEVDDLFSGRVPLSEFPRRLGLSSFEGQALVTQLLDEKAIRPFRGPELLKRFRAALKDDMQYALKLYECALESPEFEAKGKFLDRVFFGSAEFREASLKDQLRFTARMKGKRAFELLLGMFRQGIACEFSAHEEGRRVELGLSKMSLVFRMQDDAPPLDVQKFLLARSPVSEQDMAQVREMQAQTGRSLRQLLVGGGYVSMNDWFRAQKDAVLNELFNTFFLHRPYVEVRTGEFQAGEDTGRDVDVPLLPWLHAEVMKEVREWEGMLNRLPSARMFLVLSESAREALEGDGEGGEEKDPDPFTLFDGRRSLEEVLALQTQHTPQGFVREVYKRLVAGDLKPLGGDEFRELIEFVLAVGKRERALEVCVSAIESDVDPFYFRERLNQLEAAEAEITEQTSRPTLRGDLKSFSLAEVLQSFNLSKRSGTLRVAEEGIEERSREIYFESGDVYLLTGGGDISEEDLLETELVAAGIVSEDQLAKEAAVQLKDELYEIFLWEGAEFEFAAMQLPPEFYSSSRHRKLKLNTREFLLEAVRRAAEWENVRKVIPTDDVVLSFESSELKMKTISEQGREELLLLVDGRHGVADLVRISGYSRFKSLSLLARLKEQGLLKVVDVAAQQEADEDAIMSADIPTSGVIEEGFVGQLQFVATLQDMSGASMTGVLRVTDGRRSKEIALVEGVPYRTRPFRGELNGTAEGRASSTSDAAQDFSECFSWTGTRFELLDGTLPPKLEDAEQRRDLELDPDVFFDAFAEAGERWGLVAELVPRDQALAYKEGEGVKERAAVQAGAERLADLIDGRNSAEDVARLFGDRYHAMSWLVGLFEEGLVVAADVSSDEASDEEWDFSL